jgi:hypothetical protein
MYSRNVAQVKHAAGLFKNAEQAGSMFYALKPGDHSEPRRRIEDSEICKEIAKYCMCSRNIA